MQDLEKARWWLKDHMAHRECQQYPISSKSTDACRLIAAGCDPKNQGFERQFFFAIADGRYGDALQNIEWMISDAAKVKHNYQNIWLGRFKTKEEALEAARLKRLDLYTHNDSDRMSK